LLWVDPGVDLALVALCSIPFGPWAMQAWPALSDAVLTWAGETRYCTSGDETG